MKVYILIFTMTLFGSFGALFFKKASPQINGLVSMIKNLKLWYGAIFYAAGALLNIFLLKSNDYSIIYPSTSITYIWSLLISSVFLKEKISIKKICGIAAICIGVFLIAQ